MSSAGTLYVVATPIGNLEDMTYRAVRVLGSVDLIAAEDTRSAARLLSHFNIQGPRVMSLFEGNEASRTASLLATLAEGKTVALISEAGTPGISDPGERVVRAAVAAGIRVEAIPGPVAAITALVASGLPTERFLFVGFLPREPGARRAAIGSLRREVATLIAYESPERAGATLADLAEGLGPERPAVLARELTKRFEEHVRGPLGVLAERFASEAPRGECTLVIQGAPPEAAGEPEMDITATMRALLAEGVSAKDAAGRLVVATGKPRRQLYQLALSLKREVESNVERDVDSGATTRGDE